MAFNPEDFLAQWQQMMDAANAANEGRYQQGLELLTNRYNLGAGLFGRAFENIQGLGQQALSDVGRRHQEADASTSQSLIDRGFYNSTVKDALERRNLEERNRGEADIRERQAGMRANLLTQQAGFLDSILGDRLGFMERRTDLAPSFSDILPLLQQYAQGQSDRSSGGGGYSFLGANPSRFSGGGGGIFGNMQFGGAQGGGGYGGGGYGSGGSSGIHPLTNTSGQRSGGGSIWDMQQTVQDQINASGQNEGGGAGRIYVWHPTYGGGYRDSPPTGPGWVRISDNHYEYRG